MEFEIIIVAVSALIVVIILYFSLKPRPLPGIPHNTHLPWLVGDIPFFARAVKESGRLAKAPELLVERFGPISQVSRFMWDS